MKINTRGFTLIELLVVIAIIGILSSVVLVSLNSARSKGNDAKIQSTVAGLRAGMEVFYSSGNTYIGATSTAPVVSYVTSLTQMNASYMSAASSSGYSFAAQLNSDNAKAFCVDAVGNATTTLWTSVDTSVELGDAAGCL